VEESKTLKKFKNVKKFIDVKKILKKKVEEDKNPEPKEAE